MSMQRAAAAQPGVRTDRVFTVGGLPAGHEPKWLTGVVEEFSRNVSDRGYPCHFGRQAYLSGDLHGTWLGHGDDVRLLAADLRAFLDDAREAPGRRSVLACFFEPESRELPHTAYADRFWSLLDDLRALDRAAWPADVPASPDDPHWEFCFHGAPMFVFAAAPTHTLRLSRRLSAGMVVLFQPREVFRGIEGGTPGGIAARRRIRDSLARWDLVPLHPVMGDYGDPAHLEWKQYAIADHDRALFSRCPLATEHGRTLVDLLRTQAEHTPTALALVAGDTALDYRTLFLRADALAGQLVAKGVRPEDRIGIMADRSAETVVSILAVLVAGACYVPIDPRYPETRRALLLEQADADIVLTRRALVSTVPVGPRWLMISDDPVASGESPPGRRPQRAPLSARPDNLAYVIFTSGSTGTPKGVAVSHRQIVHAICAQYEVERPWPEAFLLSASFSFDASAVGLYWTLTTGGCVVLPRDGEHNDPQRLRRLIEHYGITHTDCAPSLYDLVLGDDAGPLESLQCVQVGGETCPPELLARHRRLLPECTFENNYGPTEATIWSTTYVAGPSTPLPHRSVPIGPAVPGARVYLLDESLTPVSPGEVGELYVGGAGVARGYLDRPAATAERFLADPFSGRPGGRMYRTGDLARELPDGSFDFVGRRDGQVKLRGYRVELGEVESALRRHPDVAEAVVDVRPVGEEQLLVGFVRPVAGRRCSDVTLVSHLQPLLPDYMVPRRFVYVTEMPQLVSGKIDRSQLPSPSRPVSSDALDVSVSAGGGS